MKDIPMIPMGRQLVECCFRYDHQTFGRCVPKDKSIAQMSDSEKSILNFDILCSGDYFTRMIFTGHTNVSELLYEP